MWPDCLIRLPCEIKRNELNDADDLGARECVPQSIARGNDSNFDFSAQKVDGSQEGGRLGQRWVQAGPTSLMLAQLGYSTVPQPGVGWGHPCGDNLAYASQSLQARRMGQPVWIMVPDDGGDSSQILRGPPRTPRCPSVASMPGRRLRRRPGIEATLGEVNTLR